MDQTVLDNALDRIPRTRLQGERLELAQAIRNLPQVVPSPRAKAAGLERLLMAVKLKRQNRQAQQGGDGSTTQTIAPSLCAQK